MTGGGIVALVAYGAQNVILSGNPQMTYFYKAFRRYSHFAMENISIPLDGPNELNFDQPVKLRAKIPRFGDLISDMYFVFRIPDIYSKFAEGRAAQYEFQWTQYLGSAIIQNAAFFVGGQKIHEVDGTYLLSKALLDYDTDKFEKWKWLVGQTPEMTNPAQGSFAGGGPAKTGYPTVYADPTIGSAPQLNRPSIFGRDIYIPLKFWFTENPSQALPLVGLQYHDCEVQITLAPISELYTVTDASGYRVNPTFTMIADPAQIQQNLPSYASFTDPALQIRNFFTDISYSVPPMNAWFLNARLETTFIYLPSEEQAVFASKPLSYLITQVTPYPFPGIYNRQVLDLQTHNPITRLLLTQQRSDALQRNDFANFTNWWAWPTAPYSPTPGVAPGTPTSGLLLTAAQQDMIRAVRVLCDGNEIQEQKSIDFFTRVSPYKYAIGIGREGLPIYSFQITHPGIQPSGSINSSRIRNFQVEVDVFPLPPDTTYTYDLNFYVENINWFEVASGMGGLKYAL
jgi:hypothetical protein